MQRGGFSESESEKPQSGEHANGSTYHSVNITYCLRLGRFQIKQMGRRKRARSSSEEEASSEPEESEDESEEEESEEIERKATNSKR